MSLVTDILLIVFVLVLGVFMMWYINQPVKKKRRSKSDRAMRIIEREQRIRMFKMVMIGLGVLIYAGTYIYFSIMGWGLEMHQFVLTILVLWVLYRFFTGKKLF